MRFEDDKATFCPVQAAIRALTRWNQFKLPPLTPVFCYGSAGNVSYLHDAAVTKLLRDITSETYSNPSHIYRKRLQDIRTHSLRVSACLILVSAGLPTPAIEHRLRWASDAWKVYVRESLSHMDKAASSSFFTALDEDNIAAAPEAHQAFDADDLL